MNFNRHALSPVEILSNIHRVPLILSFLRTFTLANAHTGATQPYLNVVLVLSSQSTLVPVIRDITEMWQNSQSKNSEENWKVQGKNILVSRVLFLKRREFKRSMNHDLFFFYISLNSMVFKESRRRNRSFLIFPFDWIIRRDIFSLKNLIE